MKLYNAIASLLSFSLSKAEELTQTGLILQHYGSNLLNSIMSSVGYTSQDSETITSHGCWCGKLDIKNHPFPELLGGNQPIDELDEICKDWFMCRHCNDKLVGGSCSDGGNSFTSRQNLLSGEYTMAINQTYLDSSACVESSDTCGFDTCVIDRYYANKIVEYYGNNLVPNYINEYNTEAGAGDTDNYSAADMVRISDFPAFNEGATLDFTFEFEVKTNNNARVAFCEDDSCIELVLGGKLNTKSFFRTTWQNPGVAGELLDNPLTTFLDTPSILDEDNFKAFKVVFTPSTIKGYKESDVVDQKYEEQPFFEVENYLDNPNVNFVSGINNIRIITAFESDGGHWRIVREQLLTHLVVSPGTCSSASYNHENKTCQGTAPYLNIVKVESTTDVGDTIDYSDEQLLRSTYSLDVPDLTIRADGSYTPQWYKYDGPMSGKTKALFYMMPIGPLPHTTWYNNKQWCEDRGWTMGEFTSEEELEFFKRNINHWSTPYNLHKPTHFWIGAQQPENGSKDNFRWNVGNQNDGEQLVDMSYIKWDTHLSGRDEYGGENRQLRYIYGGDWITRAKAEQSFPECIEDFMTGDDILCTRMYSLDKESTGEKGRIFCQLRLFEEEPAGQQIEQVTEAPPAISSEDEAELIEANWLKYDGELGGKTSQLFYYAAAQSVNWEEGVEYCRSLHEDSTMAAFATKAEYDWLKSGALKDHFGQINGFIFFGLRKMNLDLNTNSGDQTYYWTVNENLEVDQPANFDEYVPSWTKYSWGHTMNMGGLSGGWDDGVRYGDRRAGVICQLRY